MTEHEGNKAIAERWMLELWEKGDYDLANEIISPDYSRHDPFIELRGPQEYVEKVVKPLRGAFPDAEYTIEEMIAERDFVLIKWSFIGTHKGDLQGIPPTGVKAEHDGMDLLRIVDGKIVESWPGFDGVRVLKKLGVIPT
jgi:predicted ester cyclase